MLLEQVALFYSDVFDGFVEAYGLAQHLHVVEPNLALDYLQLVDRIVG